MKTLIAGLLAVWLIPAFSATAYAQRIKLGEVLRAAFKPLKPLAQELTAYLVDGSYVTGEKFAAAVFESREWTDFVRVTNMAR